MKNIFTKLANLWNRFTSESEDWEYFKYIRRYPDRAPFLEGKTKAELAQELPDWKMRSSEQALTIIGLQGKLNCELSHKAVFGSGNTQEPTELIIKVTIKPDGSVELRHDFPNLILFTQARECIESQKLGIS
jgi:hypothetical protein